MEHRRPVALWLFACCGMVFVASVIGAITRLTGSGLSITDWNPIMGAIPPLNAAAWEKAFKGYQAIPQYQVLHRGMSLQEFKGIYFWEWLHRFWDRLIGVVFAVPFVWFLIRKQIDRRMGWYLAAIFALGGLQGFVGWFMVQSGLATRTSVSPYRLAIHLALALFIYALMLWAGLGMWSSKSTVIPHKPEVLPRAPMRNDGSIIHGWLALGFLVVTMCWGAFTAGLHAGEAYNTWPLMEGEVLPAAAFTLNPAWINAFENLALVQFIHRWLGPAAMMVILSWVVKLWRNEESDLLAERCDSSPLVGEVGWGGGQQKIKLGTWSNPPLPNPPHKGEGISPLCLGGTRSKYWILALGIMAVVQVGFGLATLLSHTAIALAVLHQAGAIMLLTLVLGNLSRAGRCAGAR